jgi:hypothetical protein
MGERRSTHRVYYPLSANGAKKADDLWSLPEAATVTR